MTLTLARRGLAATLGSFALLAAGMPGLTGVASAATSVVQSGPALNTDTAYKLKATTSHMQTAGVPPVVVELTHLSETITVDGTIASGVVSATVPFVTNGQPAGPGTWDFQVCYTDCSADPTADDGTLTVVGSTPQVLSVAPASRAAKSTLAMTVTGANFGNLAAVTVLKNGAPTAGFTFGTLSYSGGTTISGPLTIGDVATGAYDIKVTNTDGKNATLAGALTVTPAVSVSSFTPDTLGKGATNYPFSLSGAEFQQGAVVSAVDPSAPTSASGVTFVVESTTSTLITGKVSVSSTAGGSSTRDIKVTNPDAGTATLPGALTIVAAPTVTSVSPNTRGQNSAAVDVTVNGSGFRTINGNQTPTVNFGPGVTYSAVLVGSPTQLTVKDVAVSATATPGSRTVTVANADGSSGSLASGFTVTSAPIPSSASPNHGSRAATKSITVSGSNFPTTPANKLHIDIQGVCNADVTPSSATSATFSCSIPVGAALGQHALTTTNLNDGGSGTCATCFTVDAFGVDAVNGNTGTEFFNNLDATYLTVTGTNLPPGSHIQLVHNPALADQPPLLAAPCPTSGGNQIDPTCGTANATSTTLKEYFDFGAAGAAPGTYDVIVVAPDASSGRCDCKVNLIGSTPTLTSVTPSAVVQGQTGRTLTITGTNLFHGDRVVFTAGDGKVKVVVGSEQVAADHQSMTFKVDVDPTASTTANTYKFQVVDSGAPPRSSNELGLAVNPAPTITSVSPAALGQGATTATGGVTVKGTNFVVNADPTKATALSACDGVTVSNVTVTDTTTITATFAVGPDTAVGACALTVTNPDSGSSTAPSLLTINPKPAPTSAAPSALSKGRSNVDVTINGSGFADSASVHPTVAFLKAGTTDSTITVNSVTFVSANELTVNVSVDPAAVAGKRSIKVTNPDLGTSTCVDCFAIATAPVGVTNVLGRPGDGQVQVSWTAPSDDGGAPITSYTIKSNPGGKQVIVPVGGATNATVTGLTNGTAYTFTVSASNAAGSSIPVGTSLAVKPAAVARLLSIAPTRVVNSPTGLGIPGGKTGKVSAGAWDIQLTGAPANATGATLSVTLGAPATYSLIQMYGTGTAAGPVVAYAPAGISKTGTAFVTFGATQGKVHIVVRGGPVHVVMDQTGWLIRADKSGDPASTTGGRFVADHRQLVKSALSGSVVPPSNPTYFYNFGNTLPAVEAVALQISTANVRTNGSVQAYSTADGKRATAHTFMKGRLSTTLVVARVSQAAGKCTSSSSEVAAANRLCIKVNGITGVSVVMVGYWEQATSSTFSGRYVGLPVQRILSTPTPRPGEITVKVPDSVPTNATSVVLQITAFGSSGASTVRVYADHATAPLEFAVNTSKGDVGTNIGLTPIASDNRFIRLKVYGASVRLYVDVIGYLN